MMCFWACQRSISQPGDDVLRRSYSVNRIDDKLARPPDSEAFTLCLGEDAKPVIFLPKLPDSYN